MPVQGPPGRLIKKGPEPALGFFEKKTGIVPKKTGLPRRHVEMSNKTTTKVFAQRARGSRERFFRFTLLLRYYYYVDVTFSSTLRYRSGRNVFVYITLP